MVFKRYKGVIRSGNTLRLTNCGYLEQYSKNSTIEMVGSSSHAECFDDQGMKFLDSFNVCYSLNKKRRWNLPEIIKGQLGKSLESLDCSVVLVELHCIKGLNNCLGFFSNEGRIRQLIPTKKKYLNYGSVINVNRTSKLTDSSSECGQMTMGGNHDLADDSTNNLLYRAVYPADINSSNIYSDPTIAKYKSRGKPWVSLSDTASKSKIPKCKKRIVNLDEHILVLDEEQEDELRFNTRVASDGSYKPTVLVYDYLCHKSRTRTSRSPRRRHRGAKRKTSMPVKLFFIEDGNESSSDDNLPDEGFIDDCPERIVSMDSENNEDTNFVPVRVVLPKEDVSTEHLNCRFQDKVSFPKCRPRKFCIDIQNDVILTLKKSVFFKKVVWQKLDLSSYLVFSFVGIYDTLHDVYEVNINIPNKQTIVRIDTMYDMMVIDLEDVYFRTLKYIEGFLLPETFIDKEKLHLKARLSLEFKTIFPITVKETNDQDLNDVMNEQSKNNSKHLVSNTNENLENHEMVLDGAVKFCGICLKGLADIAATYLQECGHCFCNTCWKEHLHLELLQRKDKINCPDCEEVVDYASMLTLANIHHIQLWKMEQLAKRCAFDTKCPNIQCGLTVRAILKHNVGVCHCGAVVCLTCGMEGHWPATCDQYEQYSRKIDSSGMRTKSYFEHNKTQPGKNCPTCHKFLVSKSRSPFMVCAHCGQDFCWSCLTPEEKHPNDRYWCYKMEPTEGTHLQIVTDILGDFTVGDQYYVRAVKSRKMRDPKHIKYMHRLVSRARSKILWWDHKNSVYQKLLVYKLFADIVDLIVELNFASEFCFVILEYERRRHTELMFGVRDIAPRLQTISFDLYDILSSLHTQNRRKTLFKLQQLKNSGQSTLVSLLNLVCKHRAC
ncbi:hypothetical protein LOTGIDRAFT_170487 [Lottia gigantea]|uniref:RBR-type E3 ubiquitin transferase n=1 Tax=Lottia gigantea TaxID=225164 RepID=V3ZD49_LOTGI|nr:hypothetical protein LOTGIDRAFT_170487 [Lottia gigantea]ESO81947.1 hypothetical protein LOTGIDRAFT_170487 [Lottia gigantea]